MTKMKSLQSSLEFGIFTFAVLFLTLTNGEQNDRHIRSNYKRPTGEFLLPQVISPHKITGLHDEPPHLQQLRIVKRSVDPLYPEIEIPENARRIKRSPQFFQRPKIGADIGLNTGGTDGDIRNALTFARKQPDLQTNRNAGHTGRVGGKIGLGNGKIGGDIELGIPEPQINVDGSGLNINGRVPKIIANAGEVGAKLAGDVSKAEAAITGLGKIGDDFLSKNTDLKLDGSLGTGSGASVGIDAGAGNIGGNIGLNIPKPEISANLGTAGAGLKLDFSDPASATTATTTPTTTTTTTPTTTTVKPTTSTAKPTTTTAKPTTSTTKPTPTTTKPSTTPTKPTTTTAAPTTTITTPITDSPTTTTEPDTGTTQAPEEDNEISETDRVTDVRPEAKPLTVAEYSVKEGELELPENYNILEPPKDSTGCFVFVKILGIHEIDEVREKLSFDMDLTVEWMDAEILAASVANNESSSNTNDTSLRKRRYAEGSMNSDLETLSPDFLNKIWRPDIYMEDLVKVEYPTIMGKPVVSLKLNKRTGFFSYSVRMTATVNCPMSFVYYPADTQRCVLRLASYSHSNDKLKIDWLEVDKDLYGVQIDDPSHNHFEVKAQGIVKMILSPVLNNPDHASYDILQFQVAGRRKLSYHLTQTYLPSAFHIFVTWLVFLIPYTLYDSRIGTTMTTLLTMTALFSSVRETAPSVSYMKAIDLWMFVCVLFVFLNLVELTVMTWLRTALEDFNKRAEEEDRRRNERNDKDPDDVYMYRGSHGKAMTDPEERHRITLTTIKKFDKLDNIFRFFEKNSFRLFIFLFLLFNIIYWVWLIIASKYCRFNEEPEVEI